MKREDIRQFLKDGANAVEIFFDSGRITEFNSLPEKEYPFAWVESLSTSTDLVSQRLIDDWSVVIHVAKLDKMDSLQNEYENIVDECDQIARKLIWQYNKILYSSDSSVTATDTLSDNETLKRTVYSLLTISGVTREPFIKKHAECLTGVILSFTLNSPDNTDVCP